MPVPDVIKLSYPAAVAELKAGGLAAVRAVYEGGCGLNAGDVCEQDPAATGTNNPGRVRLQGGVV